MKEAPCPRGKKKQVRSSENISWVSMLTRCRNKKVKAWPNYGGRGITVCDRWLSYENFFEDMGPRPKNFHLDRIDTNGNYNKENCRWVSRSDNNKNSRSAKWWYLFGIRYESLSDASIELDMPIRTISDWCNGYKGWKGKWIPPKEGCSSELKY